ncbi:Spy/CpxP family protein refolding chaperone [Paraburkholderia sp. GAS334]|uniref:Spy/CpxP family protein refolding chaperone n=1 Tax=Paraburkholderia sp. GAS334 TaxID=3035131 RepID=UPI003D1B8C60
MKKTLVILASTLAMSGAFAQTAAPASTASAPAAAPAPASGAARYEQRVEQRITYLHTQLKITPQQEPQWKAFADVMRTNGQTMSGLYEQRMAHPNQSALDDMKQYSAIATAHADGTKKLVDAFEPLYNSLSPDQKKLADTTFRHPSHAAGHHGGKGKKNAAPDDETVKP